jgi:hypothetical protein
MNGMNLKELSILELAQANGGGARKLAGFAKVQLTRSERGDTAQVSKLADSAPIGDHPMVKDDGDKAKAGLMDC